MLNFKDEDVERISEKIYNKINEEGTGSETKLFMVASCYSVYVQFSHFKNENKELDFTLTFSISTVDVGGINFFNVDYFEYRFANGGFLHRPCKNFTVDRSFYQKLVEELNVKCEVFGGHYAKYVPLYWLLLLEALITESNKSLLAEEKRSEDLSTQHNTGVS